MNIKSRENILSDMIRWGRNNNSSLTDYNPGSVIRSIYNAVASQISQLYYIAHRSYRNSRILYATGSDLDSLVSARSMTRKQAVKASVVLKFTGTIGVPIPKGTKASTADGVTFETIETKSVGANGGNYIEIDAEASIAGSAGNVRATTITEMIDTITGITTVTNEKTATGGHTNETDELLRNRAITQIASLSQGIQESYNAWAQNGHSSILKAKAEWGNPSYSDRTIVTHIVKDNGGIFTETELDAISNYIQFRAPLGVVIACQNITWENIDITAQVRLKTGYDLNTVLNNVEDNLSIYLDYRDRDWSDDVEWSDLYALINNTEGVEDISTANFEPGSNITVGDYSIAKLGNVQITEW